MVSLKISTPHPFCPVAEKDGRIYFDIRFSLSQEAEALGARWDIYERKWYVMPGHKNTDRLLQLSGYHPYYLPGHCNPHEHNCQGCMSFRRHQ